ncbi:MAG TPA: SRPBCC family protein [Stellaceae bacterium]|nr:SRPBCC family protein [Stellaceae bacterium]
MAPRDMNNLVDDRPGEGVFRVHRDVFSDPELYALERKFVFERTWNFLTVESQVARPNDFATAWIARTPILVTRDAQGRVRGFLNVCRHKGAMIIGAEQGNARYLVCPYHGWAYDCAGKNRDIKDRAAAHYEPSFDRDSHDLIELPRLESYKGLVFGSLSAEVPPLEEFLGEMRVFLDLAMDQGANGMEFVPGRVAYTYRGNWKLQLDNGVDPYHLTSTHVSFIGIQGRRRAGEGNLEARQFDWAKRAQRQAGVFCFPHGHSVFWTDQPEAEKRPIYPTIDEVRSRVGEVRAEWMLRARNIQVFPNMQIADAMTLMLRTFRPLAVDRTEMRSYCLAPIGEKPELRAWRLRQFEDFFNPTGLATPDDTVTYEDCQRGMGAEGLGFLQGYARGIGALEPGANDAARRLGILPESSAVGTFETGPETPFHPSYREWRRLMAAGFEGRKAYP